MKRNNAESGASYEGRCDDQESREMGAYRSEGAKGRLAKLRIAAPGAQHCRGADDEGQKREGDQEQTEADLRASRKPVHHVARGLSRLIGSGLNIAEKESQHKKRSGKDKEEFEGGKGAFEVHSDFV